MQIELEVHLAKDDETGRWYVSESQVPGLRVEADSAADLIRTIELVAPELIELNALEIREGLGDHAPTSDDQAVFAIRMVIDTALALV